MLSSMPLNVRFASSSSEPEVPAMIILSFVKSLTVAVEIITSPVPLGVILISPFVLVLIMLLPLMSILSTLKLPIISTSITPVPCVYVNSALSCNSPLVPTNTIRLAVKSSTLALANVA